MSEPRCASCLDWKMKASAAGHPGVFVGHCYRQQTERMSA